MTCLVIPAYCNLVGFSEDDQKQSNRAAGSLSSFSMMILCLFSHLRDYNSQSYFHNISSSVQVLTHRSGSAPLLSLIYSEVLKMLRLWGLLNFDAEVFFPHDHHSYPRGYPKQKGKESDHSHIMTAESLLVQVNISSSND